MRVNIAFLLLMWYNELSWCISGECDSSFSFWPIGFRALLLVLKGLDTMGPNPIDPNTIIHHFKLHDQSQYNKFPVGLATLNILVFLFFEKRKRNKQTKRNSLKSSNIFRKILRVKIVYLVKPQNIIFQIFRAMDFSIFFRDHGFFFLLFFFFGLMVVEELGVKIALTANYF